MTNRLTCEFGSDKDAKGFRPRFDGENAAFGFYCASVKWKEGNGWRLCKKHWMKAGGTLRQWEAGK